VILIIVFCDFVLFCVLPSLSDMIIRTSRVPKRGVMERIQAGLWK